MDSSTSKDGTRRLPAKVASAPLDAKLHAKRFKSLLGSSQILEGPEKETPAGKRGAEEATKSRSEVITHQEYFVRQVQQIGLQNILENPAAALELIKRLRSPEVPDLLNDSSDDLMAFIPSEVSFAGVSQGMLYVYAMLTEVSSEVSNLSAEAALSSSKLAEAEAKLKSYESS